MEQWSNGAIIAAVLHATASEDADESALRSIGAMVVEIWPKADTSKVVAMVVAMIVQNNQSKPWHGLQ